MGRYEMIPVAVARSGFEAKLLAARLGSEGVIWELRGDVDGLYPVGGIEVLVPSDEADRARDVLRPPDADEGPDGWTTSEGATGEVAVDVARRHRPAVVAVAVLLAIAFVVVRLVALA